MILDQKIFGKHSKYSRYSSQKKPPDPHSWSYSIDDSLWVSKPSNTLRIQSVNCCRFPKSYYSFFILANLIMSSHCDICFLQEISTLSMLSDLCRFMNTFLSTDKYRFYTGTGSVRNLSLSFIYDSSTITSDGTQTMFFNDTDCYPFFPRLPFRLNSAYSSFFTYFTNLHLISNHHTQPLFLREKAFKYLQDHLGDIPANSLLIIGGDWNQASSSSWFSTYFPEFKSDFSPYSSNADLLLLNNNAIGSLVTSGLTQYLYDFELYCGLSPSNYAIWFSDHKPIILDLPLV